MLIEIYPIVESKRDGSPSQQMQAGPTPLVPEKIDRCVQFLGGWATKSSLSCAELSRPTASSHIANAILGGGGVTKMYVIHSFIHPSFYILIGDLGCVCVCVCGIFEGT